MTDEDKAAILDGKTAEAQTPTVAGDGVTAPAPAPSDPAPTEPFPEVTPTPPSSTTPVETPAPSTPGAAPSERPKRGRPRKDATPPPGQSKLDGFEQAPPAGAAPTTPPPVVPPPPVAPKPPAKEIDLEIEGFADGVRDWLIAMGGPLRALGWPTLPNKMIRGTVWRAAKRLEKKGAQWAAEEGIDQGTADYAVVGLPIAEVLAFRYVGPGKKLSAEDGMKYALEAIAANAAEIAAEKEKKK